MEAKESGTTSDSAEREPEGDTQGTREAKMTIKETEETGERRRMENVLQ